MPRSKSDYRGRFAPSPTGPLHMGSLIAALASLLDARHHQGCWLVRMDDLDPPREEPGAAAAILQSLRHHGLCWDEDVLYQSSRAAAYGASLDRLAAGNHLFRCDCSRATLSAGGACQGNCRQRQSELCEPSSTRINVPPDCTIEFADQLQGPQKTALGETTPDFVVKRKDGLDAYQLAVVVDDAAQGVTHIVRGCDLLEPTSRQIFLQQTLGHPVPLYSHVPVITGAGGHKFSKQNHAPALVDDDACANLRLALRFLNQATPPARLNCSQEVLNFAIEHWTPAQIPRTQAIAAADIGSSG